MKVVLDTNAIIYAVKNKIDIEQAIGNLDIPKPEIVVPRSVIYELEDLTEKAKKGSDKAVARLAIQVIKFSKFKVIKIGEGHTDNIIADWATKNHAAVATNDLEFKRKLKEKSVPVFSIRQKKYIS